MTEANSKPICPSCRYDLTGLINPDTQVVCPECNSHTTYQFATERISHWPTIKLAAALLMAVPTLLSVAAWELMHYTGERLNFAGDMATLAALGFQVLYVPVVTYTFILRKFVIHNRNSSPRHYTPSSFIYFLLIGAFAGIATVLWNLCMQELGGI